MAVTSVTKFGPDEIQSALAAGRLSSRYRFLLMEYLEKGATHAASLEAPTNH
jgi:hypothetical protein